MKLKTKIWNRVLPVLLALVLLGTAFSVPVPARAMSGTVRLTPERTTINIGDQMTISFTITPSSPSLLQASIGISAGVQVVNAVVNGGEYANLVFVRASGNQAVYNGAIVIRATASGDQTVELNNVKLVDETNPANQVTLPPTVISFHVRTPEEKAAYDAAVAAEQARIREEQARQASIAASIEASKAAERERQALIEESIRRASEEEAYRESSIAESIRLSESEVERTRPTELGEKLFAELELKEKIGPATSFYFALEDQGIATPEGFEQVPLRLNECDLLALQKEGMDRNTYLVYGQFDTEHRPQFYLYNEKTEDFFPYGYLDNKWAVEEQDPTEESTDEDESTDEEDSSETAAPTSTEKRETKPVETDSFDSPANRLKLFFIALFSLLIGMAAAGIIAGLFRKSEDKHSTAKAASAKTAATSKAAPQKSAAPKTEKAAAKSQVIQFDEIDDADTGRRNRHTREIDE